MILEEIVDPPHSEEDGSDPPTLVPMEEVSTSQGSSGLANGNIAPLNTDIRHKQLKQKRKRKLTNPTAPPKEDYDGSGTDSSDEEVSLKKETSTSFDTSTQMYKL